MREYTRDVLGVISMLRIAEAREARGWTQERLAQAIGTTQQTVQRWESGQVDPQVSKVEAISKALKITMTFLLGVDENGNEVNPVLSTDERELLSLYRRMDADTARKFIETARVFTAASEKDGAGDRKDEELVGRAVR